MSAVTTAPDEALEPTDVENWNDYLTPDQRVAAIAEILATGALRVLKERYEKDTA